ncbi:MAG: hypothetical protein LBU32_15175 [Clostridiales bacterium]|jgi:hypothetical protein|nr:hypothetical protein [Clostridiales bacterium]
MDKIINETATKYAKSKKSKFNPKDAYLYGLYSKGTVREDSEIEAHMNVFGNLFALEADIDARIEPNLILDDGDIDKCSMLYEMRRTGVRIY